MFILKKEKILDSMAFFTTVLFVSSFYIFEMTNLSSFSLLFFTLIMLAIYLIRSNFKFVICFDRFHFMVLMFSIFCILSGIWAEYPILSLEKGVTILEILLCFSVFYAYLSKYSSFSDLINVIIWSGFVVSFYTIFDLGLSQIYFFINSGLRIDVQFTNINSVSNIASVSIVSIFFELIYKKKVKHLWMCIPDILIVASSGSRKSFILLTFGIILIILMKNMNGNLIKTFAKWLIYFLILLLVFHFILSLPMFEMINRRFSNMLSIFTDKANIDSSTYIRSRMILMGWKQFLKKPILGIGIGNTGKIILSETRYNNSYLHNNYIELLSSGGIIGFLIFYRMYFSNLIFFLKNKNKNDEIKICLILTICILILDFGQVTYYSKSTYFYLMIFFLCVKKNKKIKSEINNYEN